jgi:LEA14-like dessication related protein
MAIINREFSMLKKWLLLVVLAISLGACAGLTGREPVQVNVVGVEPLQGQGLEVRFAVKLRVINPNDAPVEFNGVYVALDVRGSEFATGVSDQQGTVGRFGETVLTVPVTVSATAMLKQLIGFAAGDRSKVGYQLRGKLAGAGFGSVRFDSSGEFELPAGLGGATK